MPRSMRVPARDEVTDDTPIHRRAPSRWPDGSLKHRWRTLFSTGTSVCEWCGNTRGVTTAGKPCPATFRSHLVNGGEDAA
jgi:hypothetical protein